MVKDPSEVLIMTCVILSVLAILNTWMKKHDERKELHYKMKPIEWVSPPQRRAGKTNSRDKLMTDRDDESVKKKVAVNVICRWWMTFKPQRILHHWAASEIQHFYHTQMVRSTHKLFIAKKQILPCLVLPTPVGEQSNVPMLLHNDPTLAEARKKTSAALLIQYAWLKYHQRSSCSTSQWQSMFHKAMMAKYTTAHCPQYSNLFSQMVSHELHQCRKNIHHRSRKIMKPLTSPRAA